MAIDQRIDTFAASGEEAVSPTNANQVGRG
jgi:hypothetical protein